ncbi:hypothetical protein GH714_027206 [Hevea brasiliensis]|uniref:Uncharacterized protein n=1 Tax=Hevea brasiliensis TaxID=3981 RepID=A0A6A6N2D7_HEVBR|nr:hypothetical protein GH714_027206 [Hevea brasiliensis]
MDSRCPTDSLQSLAIGPKMPHQRTIHLRNYVRNQGCSLYRLIGPNRSIQIHPNRKLGEEGSVELWIKLPIEFVNLVETAVKVIIFYICEIQLKQIFDELIREQGPKGVTERFVLVGILCVHVILAFRPTIEDAFRMLEGDIDIPTLPDRPKPLSHGAFRSSFCIDSLTASER